MTQSTVTYEEWVVSKERLAEYVAALSPVAYEGPERRHSERRAMVVTVDAVPLDENLEPLGVRVFKMFTSDISEKGLGMFYVHSIDAKYLALTMQSNRGTEIKVMVEVIRCEPTDLDPNLFRIGTRFVTQG